MPLAERVQSEPRRKPTGLPCSIGKLLDTLEGAELAALRSMLYELGWSAHRIYEALEAEGHIVGEQTINRHRSQSCRCYKVDR